MLGISPGSLLGIDSLLRVLWGLDRVREIEFSESAFDTITWYIMEIGGSTLRANSELSVLQVSIYSCMVAPLMMKRVQSLLEENTPNHEPHI